MAHSENYDATLLLQWLHRGEGSLKSEMCFMFLRPDIETFRELCKIQFIVRVLGCRLSAMKDGALLWIVVNQNGKKMVISN